MNNYTLEELEFFLKDEKERADKVENDDFLKELLNNRVKMWERLIKEFHSG